MPKTKWKYYTNGDLTKFKGLLEPEDNFQINKEISRRIKQGSHLRKKGV